MSSHFSYKSHFDDSCEFNFNESGPFKVIFFYQIVLRRHFAGLFSVASHLKSVVTCVFLKLDKLTANQRVNHYQMTSLLGKCIISNDEKNIEVFQVDNCCTMSYQLLHQFGDLVVSTVGF